MEVEVTPEVGLDYQVGQAAFPCGVQLVSAAAEFRRYPGQVQATVEGLLVREVFGFAAFDDGDAVFVQGQAPAVGVIAQTDVVLLAAGEVLKHRAHGVGLADAQVDLDARVHYHGGLGVALDQYLADGGQGGQGWAGFGRIFRHGDEVEVADGLLPAAQRTGRGDAHQPGAGVKQLGGHCGARLGGDA